MLTAQQQKIDSEIRDKMAQLNDLQQKINAVDEEIKNLQYLKTFGANLKSVTFSTVTFDQLPSPMIGVFLQEVEAHLTSKRQSIVDQAAAILSPAK